MSVSGNENKIIDEREKQKKKKKKKKKKKTEKNKCGQKL